MAIPASCCSCFCLWPGLAGRKPTNWKALQLSPEATKAASTAEGPAGNMHPSPLEAARASTAAHASAACICHCLCLSCARPATSSDCALAHSKCQVSPGTGTTGSPAATAAATSLAPGSLTAGTPASDTSATEAPPLTRCRTWTAGPTAAAVLDSQGHHEHVGFSSLSPMIC